MNRRRLSWSILVGVSLACAVVGCLGEPGGSRPLLTPGNTPPGMVASYRPRAAPTNWTLPPAYSREGEDQDAVGPSRAAPAADPVRNEDKEKKKPKTVTLTLDDVEVRKALDLLAQEAQWNILASPGVTGRITISIKGVSHEQALKAILQTANLIAQREGNILSVYTPEEMNRKEEEHLPLRVYCLNYTKSTDLMNMIRPFLSARGKITATAASAVGLGGHGGAGGSSGGASGGTSGGGAPAEGGGAAAAGGGGGTSGSPSGGNSLAGGEAIIVQDREAVLQVIDQVVAKLDVQPYQVLIEAVILTLEMDKNQEFGVNLAVADATGKILSVVGNGATINASVGFLPALTTTPGGQVTGNSGTGFAASDAASKFGFTSRTVTGFLRALDSLGKIEILAAPRLLVLNKQLAELQLGNRLGYTTFSQSQVSTVQQVQFLDVGTLLRVRPFVSSDGMIRMEVHPERSTGSVVNGIPQTATSEVTTNVLVPDGATLMIGGLIDNDQERHQDGLPIASRVPILGALFRQRTQTLTKRELVVFLTPKLWHPNGPTPLSPGVINGAPVIPLRMPGTRP